MKSLILLLLTGVSLCWVRADVSIEQKLEGISEGVVMMKIKGDQGRMDILMAPTNLSMILNWKTDSVTILKHEQKRFAVMKLSELKAKTPPSKFDPTKVKNATSTGKKEKLNGFDTELFELEVDGKKVRMWIDVAFPHYKEVNAQLNALTGAVSNEPTLDPEQFGIHGMPIKTEVETSSGKITTTITQFSEDPILPALFEVPVNYDAIKLK